MFYKIDNQKLNQQEIAERNQQKSKFPNKISDGSFTPHSTILEVSCFRTDLVKSALQSKNLLPVRKDLQVLMHEMTHWFDFFGTVWGRRYISVICRAYRAVQCKDESGFPDIIKLYDMDRRILSPSYYRFTSQPSQPHNVKHPWTIEFLTGVEIDPYGETRVDRPMFMVKFGENPSRVTFARQPISVGSLLEVRAMAAEIRAAFEVINSMKNSDESKIEQHIASGEFEAILYDYELIEYNSAVHLFAVKSGIQNPILAYDLAASIAYLALNMKGSDFKKLKIPSEFKLFGNRNKSFKKNLDIGFAFACMVFNAGKFQGDEDEYLSSCLVSSNLGCIEAFLSKATLKLEEPLRISGTTDEIEHFTQETKLGSKILGKTQKKKNFIFEISDLSGDLQEIIPPFVDSNCEFFEFHKGRHKNYHINQMHKSSHTLFDYTYNLMTGCRGFPLK